ncbi:LAGLIDADG family homing endonuclease [Nocardia inohanensis]|uniref:LAGLIDADG family homing endonuclease n=1 Tax=Nocardia inohanensis TaxID=209246 RepID=UPI000A0282F1|nr:LAGLIDADG family homing endonuclease [Nocardia inohanensis]
MPSPRILRADNGSEVCVRDLLESGERPSVWTLDGRLRLVPKPVEKILNVGSRKVFRVRLASGREVEATGDQCLSTVAGWVPIRLLAADARVATPRKVPSPLHTDRVPDAEVILLAHMIGDGSCVKRQPIRYASIDEANLAAVTRAAAHFGVTGVRDEYPAARVTTLRLPAPYRLTHGKRNPIAAWLDELGLFGLRSYDKFIPDQIFALSNGQVALFVRHLWATDGSVRWDTKGQQARVYYASTSRRLIDGLLQLLLRLNVRGRVKRFGKAGYRDCWQLTIDGAANQTTFLRDVGVHGARGLAAEVALVHLADIRCNTNVDTIPKEIWGRVRTVLAAKGIAHRDFQAMIGSNFRGSAMWEGSPSRGRLLKIATALQDSALTSLATSDVFWDRIVEISELGEQDLVDVVIADTHNYVAQGISVHDSETPCRSNSR